MQLAMTLLCRNEADIIASTIRFHLDRGIDVMIVTDNGCGLDDSQINRVPKSLSRRARLAGAHVSSGRLADGGTSITLKRCTKRFGMF